MRHITLLLFLIASFSASAQNKCAPTLDAHVNGIEVYRDAVFDKELNQCIPSSESFVLLKGKALKSSVQLKGFVVGIETLTNNSLGKVVKLTTKSGGNSTTVYLFKVHKGKLEKIRGAVFSSNSENIIVTKDGPEYLSVKVRYGGFDENDCQALFEETHYFINGKFKLQGKKVVEKRCA